MQNHVFVQMSKITNVAGRVDYISNPKRQEHLYATYSTVEPVFWKYLADQNQLDFTQSGTKGKCIEARELIIALPKSFTAYDPQLLLQAFTESFRNEYGVQCTAALHHNKAMTNYHIHLIFSERKALEKRETKTATRNMFYDENGKHVRTRKEILDSAGNVRPGCRIIAKGSPYESNYFAAKESKFKQREFVAEVKKSYAELINILIKDETQKLTVFDPSGPYLPTEKIGKNNPKAEEMRSDNEARQEWNRTVDEALVSGIPEEDVQIVRKEYISKSVAASIAEQGFLPEKLYGILKNAVKKLQERIRMFRLRLVPKQSLSDHNRKILQQLIPVKTKLDQKMSVIRKTDEKIGLIDSRLESMSGFAGIGKGKAKTELMQKRLAYINEKSALAEEMKRIVQSAGYDTVRSFMTDYAKLCDLVRRDGTEEADGLKKASSKESILSRLNENKAILENVGKTVAGKKRDQQLIANKSNERI